MSAPGRWSRAFSRFATRKGADTGLLCLDARKEVTRTRQQGKCSRARFHAPDSPALFRCSQGHRRRDVPQELTYQLVAGQNDAGTMILSSNCQGSQGFARHEAMQLRVNAAAASCGLALGAPVAAGSGVIV